MDKLELGKNIRCHREQSGMSQDKLAEVVGMSTVFISRIEQGKKSPSLDSLIKIANALSATSDELLGYQIQNYYTIKASKLSEMLSQLPSLEQKKIHNVVDIMVQNYNEILEIEK